MNATRLLAIEVPLAARLIELFDDGEVPMHAQDYRAVSSQLLDSLASTPTHRLVELARTHGDYGPAQLQAPPPRRRLRVLGELASNAAFVRVGRLLDASPEAAAQARCVSDALMARLRQAPAVPRRPAC